MGDAVSARLGFCPDACGQWVARVNLVLDFESVGGDVGGRALAGEASLGEADMSRWRPPPYRHLNSRVEQRHRSAGKWVNPGSCVAHANRPR